jgi:penicillin-binding protein 1A
MEGGLTNSVNSISVNLITQYGIDKTIDLAHKMGIQSKIPEVPSIALGTAELPLYEMVNAYASLANHGVRPELKYLLRIEDKNGKILYPIEEEVEQNPVQALDSLTNQMVVHMMESVIDSGTGRRLRNTYGLTGDMAGKTGTTQNHSDGWFIGYTPDIVAGVWVGGASPKVRFRSLNLGAGGNMALPIWGKFMQKAVRDKSFSQWQHNSFPILADRSYNEL